MTNDARLTGSAYWASRAADAFDALAHIAETRGQHGNAAQHRQQAADCREYLERYGLRDSAAADMLHALKAVKRDGAEWPRGADLAAIRKSDAYRTAWGCVNVAIEKAEGRADG